VACVQAVCVLVRVAENSTGLTRSTRRWTASTSTDRVVVQCSWVLSLVLAMCTDWPSTITRPTSAAGRATCPWFKSSCLAEHLKSLSPVYPAGLCLAMLMSPHHNNQQVLSSVSSTSAVSRMGCIVAYQPPSYENWKHCFITRVFWTTSRQFTVSSYKLYAGTLLTV